MPPGVFIIVAVFMTVSLPVQAAHVITRPEVTDGVKVREDPTRDSLYIDTLRPGQRGTLLGSVPYWFEIMMTTAGRIGFVPQRWTDLVDGDVSFAILFSDVGTGDAITIDMGDREIVLDGGAGARRLYDYVDETRTVSDPIELVVVTHAASDHWRSLVVSQESDNVVALDSFSSP